MRSMLALTALALASAASAQTTWYVDTNGTPPGSGTVADPYTSINYAVSQPSTISGDVVEVAPGTYRELIFILAKGVHVKSSGGAAVTIVDAGGAGSAVAVLGKNGTMTILEGLTLTNGVGTGNAGPQGGGLYATSSLLRVSDCIIENNKTKVVDAWVWTCLRKVKLAPQCLDDDRRLRLHSSRRSQVGIRMKQGDSGRETPSALRLEALSGKGACQ